MSKAAIAELARNINKEVLSKSIRKEILDLKTHVFMINEAAIKDGFGEHLGLDNETQINAAVKELTIEFKKAARKIVKYEIDPISLEGYDPKKSVLHRVEFGDSLFVIATAQKKEGSSYDTLSKSFLYKLRDNLSKRFKGETFQFFYDTGGGKLASANATNILGTKTIPVGESSFNKKRFADIGHTAGFGREEENTPLGKKLSLAKRMAEAAGDPQSIALASTIQGFIERLTGVHYQYTIETRKDLGDAAFLAKNKGIIGIGSFIFLLPQHYSTNQELLGRIEDQISKEFRKVIDDLKGSPSLKELLIQTILEAFQFGKPKNVSHRAKVTQEEKIPGVKGQGYTFKKSSSSLRDVKGKFFSVLRLQNLINSQLHDRLKKNMGSGYSSDRLNYRTGRFAKSAKVTAITPADQLLNTYFTYMKYPYATFAPGGKQYRGGGRDPEVLIDMTIREIAIGLVSKQFKVVPKVVQ